MTLSAAEVAELVKYGIPDLFAKYLDERGTDADSVARLKANVLAASGLLVVKRKITIAFGASMPVATTFDVNLGAVLPASVRWLAGVGLENWTGFDDATHSTYALTVGTAAGGNQVATTQSVAAGQSGFPKIMSAGAGLYVGSNALTAAQLSARLTSGVNLSTATVGTVDLVLMTLE